LVKDFIPQPTPKETPSTWGRNREFPPDFTEEDRIILTEQFHDYERVNEKMDEDYLRFLTLLKTYISYSSILEVVQYKNDCFVHPVLIAVKTGQAITVKNNNGISVNMGIGGEDWYIPEYGEVIVYPKLIEEVENQKIWGYACGDKGMGGYFVSAD